MVLQAYNGYVVIPINDFWSTEVNGMHCTQRAYFPAKSALCMSLKCVPGKRFFLGLVDINEE
jgi:hypothetical protein